MKILRLNNRGDTIVEVLIAMAVASSVLGGAYVIVNRTQQNSQQAQEHSEALGIAQGQIEQLQALASGTDTAKSAPLYNVAFPQHCFSAAGTLVVFSPLVSLPTTSQSGYPAACKSLGTNQFYRTIIVYAPALNGNPDFFTVYVNWPSATGHGDDQVSLSYRPYHP